MSENVLKITNIIDESHTKFLEEVGEIPYKVSADYQLLISIVCSKLGLVAHLLQERGVIDDYIFTNWGEYTTLSMSKSGLDFRVEVLTNGTAICMKTENAMVDSESEFMTKQWYKPDSQKGWDWPDFTQNLLDFIHFTMYKSQKVEEVNLELLMEGEGR